MSPVLDTKLPNTTRAVDASNPVTPERPPEKPQDTACTPADPFNRMYETAGIGSDRLEMNRSMQAQVQQQQVSRMQIQTHPSPQLQEIFNKVGDNDEEQERILDLGDDPAVGDTRETEMIAAFRLEQMVGHRIMRSDDPSVDWVDDQGTTYDAVGPLQKPEFFNPNTFVRSIERHLDKSQKPTLDYLLVDLTGLDYVAHDQVHGYLDRLNALQRSRVLLVD